MLSILDEVAAGGGLTPSRLPELVLTLERNRSWWTTGPLLSSGQRVGFAGSQLVWQYYPGQGIQIQWLGTFGKANGYFLGGTTHNTQLAALLDEAVGLAVQRAGGIAWEYDFHFDGGSPPWVSGLAEGTAVQALGRAAVRFGRPDYFTAASAGLGIFSAPPPTGVRVGTPLGARYLIYSFAPHELVLNAFIQALVGLYDYGNLSNSDAVRALFSAGEAQARVDVPHYDTGAWSLYDQSTESDLSYHVLLRDFLSHLCERLSAPATVAQTVITPPPPAPTVGPSGGTPATPAPAPAPAPVPTPAPAPAAGVYCTTAAHFTSYMHQPPVLAIEPVHRARAGRPVDLRLLLSKISTVTLQASRGGRTVYSAREQLGHGTRTLVWDPPAAGSYRFTASATDLAGNSAHAAAVDRHRRRALTLGRTVDSGRRWPARTILYTGKGGVGKTSVAAATARRCAAAGARTMIALHRSGAQPLRLAGRPARRRADARSASISGARRSTPRTSSSATGRPSRSGSARSSSSAASTASRPRS